MLNQSICYAQTASVSVGTPTVGNGTINVTVQVTSGADWNTVTKITVFVAKNGSATQSMSSTNGQNTFNFTGLAVDKYKVWAVVEYKKNVQGPKGPTPSAETYIFLSDPVEVNVTNAGANNTTPTPHATASDLNAPFGTAGITSLGTVKALDAGWSVQSVELYVVPSGGGTPTIGKQDYNPLGTTPPVKWDITVKPLAAGAYQVYVIITLKNGSDSQQILMGPDSITLS